MRDADDPTDAAPHVVLVSHLGYLSLQRADRELPLGWKLEGFQGTKQECLDHIRAIDVDGTLMTDPDHDHDRER